jgi:hypothetical protein
MSDDNIGAIATIVGSVIALSGSIIIIYLADRVKQKNQEIVQYERLLHGYMLQLQHMITSLWYRFENLSHRGIENYVGSKEKDEYVLIEEEESVNKPKREDRYIIISTLYALGCVLAYNRIMLLEGVYSKLQDKENTFYNHWTSWLNKLSFNSHNKKPQISGDWLKRNLEEFDNKLEYLHGRESPFFRYARIALADALIKRAQDGRLFIKTYSEFYGEYRNNISYIKVSLYPAINFVLRLKNQNYPQENNKELTLLEEIMEKLRCIHNELKTTSITADSIKDKCNRCKKLSDLRGSLPCIETEDG